MCHASSVRSLNPLVIVCSLRHTESIERDVEWLGYGWDGPARYGAGHHNSSPRCANVDACRCFVTVAGLSLGSRCWSPATSPASDYFPAMEIFAAELIAQVPGPSKRS